jgi:hypothetical protein
MTAYQRIVLRLLYHMVRNTVSRNDAEAQKAIKDARQMLTDDTDPGEDAPI